MIYHKFFTFLYWDIYLDVEKTKGYNFDFYWEDSDNLIIKLLSQKIIISRKIK
tara:strand:- start:25 stop:183 length:159 start_codon:yes stop_codon:yes gene_type:complete